MPKITFIGAGSTVFAKRLLVAGISLTCQKSGFCLGARALACSSLI